MSDKKPTEAPRKDSAKQQAKKEKLASALRANLKRRKAAPRPVKKS